MGSLSGVRLKEEGRSEAHFAEIASKIGGWGLRAVKMIVLNRCHLILYCQSRGCERIIVFDLSPFVGLRPMILNPELIPGPAINLLDPNPKHAPHPVDFQLHARP